jgi:hypothetical protein
VFILSVSLSLFPKGKDRLIPVVRFTSVVYFYSAEIAGSDPAEWYSFTPVFTPAAVG